MALSRFVLPLRNPLSFCRSDAAAERYIAFVNGALALRATAAKEPAFVEDLAISFDISEQETGQLVPLSVEAAQGWIRYAVQHAVKSFILKLMLPWQWRFDLDRDDNDIEHPVMTLDEMDNHYAKMETMHLRLDLSLQDIEVPAGGGYLLSRLMSSACCPRLHKLRLRQLSFELSTMEVMLLIEANTLLELSLESMFELQFLELRTPSLQVLHIEDSFDLNGFTVSAPRLENLRFCVQQPLHIDDVHGQLSSVGTLKIQMFSHGETDNEDRNDASIHLLQCCRLTRCLCLLKFQSNIKYLRLQLCYIIKKKNQSELDLLCDNNSCHWRSHEFSLDHLEKVEFKELMGTDCEFQFIQSILTKATGIRKVGGPGAIRRSWRLRPVAAIPVPDIG
ncbi:unnamed protein product [Miscanthus lutarioriparius]|uniref:Uncharacterized protein n=1 Tax=Miscanthus lutarioriparius TaxID=422564 RepID=A0A811QRW9_9POAL|nr:unnamed protein product [Miscanthus lutarioriparius]